MCDFDSQNDPRIQIVHMKKIQAKGLELFIKKNADYGNSYKQYGLIGVLVRIQDKINRCLNITKNGIHVQDESLGDTLIDLHNYAAMALMESDQNPRVPNLPTMTESEATVPIRTYGSEPSLTNRVELDTKVPNLPTMMNASSTSSFQPIRESKVLVRGPRDSLLSLSAAERACIDHCINLK